LDGDVLHLSTTGFWSMWFPLDDRERQEEYRRAAIGLIAGDYRIVTHFACGLPVKEVLERPVGKDWEPVYTARRMFYHWLPWGRETKFIRNTGE